MTVLITEVLWGVLDFSSCLQRLKIMTKFVLIWFLLVNLGLFVHAKLCDYGDIQCGNICVDLDDYYYSDSYEVDEYSDSNQQPNCQCGTKTITSNDQQCCTESPCDETTNTCPNGTVISWDDQCFGQCIQRKYYNFVPTCPNKCTRIDSEQMCHGLRFGSCDESNQEDEICAKSDSLQCGTWKSCGQVPGAKFTQPS